MKTFHVHYKNKYPDAQVVSTEKSLDVFQDGKHLVSIGKDAAGNFKDYSKEKGCEYGHDLCPLPKRVRIYKACPISGHIVKDELHESRLERQDENNWCEESGCRRARSIHEIKSNPLVEVEEKLSSKKVSKVAKKK